jgi:hemerythrin-like metal-binding protein
MYEWQDSFSVGVPGFDKAHQQLFDLFQQFYIDLKAGKSQDQVAATLEKTYEYTKQHFDSEETWLAARNYPKLAEHREQHRKFKQQIEKYLEDYRSGKLVLSGVVSKTLREWLTGHIMEIDQQYARSLVAGTMKH